MDGLGMILLIAFIIWLIFGGRKKSSSTSSPHRPGAISTGGGTIRSSKQSADERFQQQHEDLHFRLAGKSGAQRCPFCSKIL